MRFGIDRLIDEDFAALHGKRIGLFTNLSAVNRDLVTTYDLFHRTESVQMTAIFSPEHGLGAAVADAVKVKDAVDARTGLPVYSLYGSTLRPTPEMLADIDLMVCDIQDVGVRYYTFLWSLTHILEACGEFGVPVLVLDRPNPLGARMDGGGLHPELASFVGRYPIPAQHGMTLGELAQMINATWNPTPADLNCMPCDGWERGQTWNQIGRAFVTPSPNMPHVVTALHYPGSCLIEGTRLSEGRGTPLPFEIVGAPYIDSWVLSEAVNDLGYEGVRARPHQFQPSASKYKGEFCGGIQLHITDVAAYRPLPVWIAIIKLIRHMYPDDFEWLPSYRPHGFHHFDALIGDRETRLAMDADEPVERITAGWEAFLRAFETAREPFLLYVD